MRITTRDVKPLRSPGEVISLEQIAMEKSGWIFIANFDQKEDKVYLKYARKGFMTSRFGNAYDWNENPIPSLRALYVKPYCS